MIIHPEKSSVAAGLLAVSISLLLAIFACDLPVSPDGSDASLQQTNVALGVQQTLIAANEATLQAQQTQLASTPTLPQIDIQPTLDAQATVIALQLTQTAEALTPEATLASPTELAPPMEKIPLVDWKGVNVRKVPQNTCYLENLGVCWFGQASTSDYPWHPGYGKSAEIRLSLESPILVESSWRNPYLIFWHKYQFTSEGYLSVRNENTNEWSYLLALPPGYSTWKQVTLNISGFKDCKIYLLFFTSGTAGKKGANIVTYWYIQDIHINPNYEP